MLERKYDPKEVEKWVKEFWEKNSIPQKVLKFRKGNRKFFFMDGPPYATGRIHMGTAWNKILKDFYLRFFRMLGYDVWAQPGYDTHGLPIENKVEKKLGFKKKEDIEKFGIENFNKECKKFATEFIDVMNSQFENLGVWMDWKNPYLTLSNEYIEGAWYTFKVAFEKGFLYKGIYPVHVCPHCATAVAYNEIEYFKAVDPSIAVKFRIKDNEFLVIWTTTPWTLLANTGIMVHPKYEYARVKVDDEILIFAKDLIEENMEKAKIDKYEILETFKGSDLEGVTYENPLKDVVPLQQKIKPKVVLSEQFVKLDEGTGLVHTAPGHGKEDYKVGKENDIQVICPVRLNGTYDDSVGMFSGMHVRDANPLIIEELKKRNALFYEEKITHEYPQCWRCKSPLLLMCVPQWFFKVTAIRDKLIEENSEVKWVPEWGKKRFKNWLESLDDWPISRQRYWGIPLPIWVCEECEEIKVVGSADELPEKPKDLHRPYIDEIKLNCKCGGKMKRVPDVLDVWFDSGVASWASLGYPKNKKLFEEMWPADLNIEGADQIRGWWNSEMITSVITFGKKPFKAIILHGLVLDAKGVKMSKSLGNIVSPEDVIEKYGRDVLRFYLLRSDPGNDFYFNWRSVEESFRTFTILYNIGVFFDTYCIPGELKDLKPEDRWIVSRINSLIKKCKKYNKDYTGFKSVEVIEKFLVEDLSRWYIKLIRERTWLPGRENETASATLLYVLDRLIKILSPISPFITELLYQRILREYNKNESVHLCEWPEVDENSIDGELENMMKMVREIIETANSIRREKKIKLRYPLPKITISGNERVIKTVETLKDVIKKMANVKEVEIKELEEGYEVKPNYASLGKKYGKETKRIVSLLKEKDAKKLKKEMDENGEVKLNGFILKREDLIFKPLGEGSEFKGGRVILDLTATDELKKEWLLRELIRNVQEKRKEMGLNVRDRIKLYIPEEFKEFKETIERETGSKVIFGEGGKRSHFELEGRKYVFGTEIT